jgi:hypothetical protein
MSLEINLPGGIIPFQTSTSHEYQSAPGAPPVLNPTIVDRANDYHVHAHWHTQGSIFALMNPAFKWKGEAIFELMGAGEFVGAPFNASVPFTPTAANQHYDMRIDIPAGAVPDGIYRIILKLALDTSSAGLTTTPICGFEDLGLVEFYN